LGDGAHHLLPSQEGYQTDRIVNVLDELASAHQTTRSAVALAWLLKHPAGIMPVVGSVQPERIRQATQADTISLTREAWYQLLEAALGRRLP